MIVKFTEDKLTGTTYAFLNGKRASNHDASVLVNRYTAKCRKADDTPHRTVTYDGRYERTQYKFHESEL